MLPITPETQWPPAGWLTKKTAAERLNRSESRIAAMIRDEGTPRTETQPLQSRKLENPKSKQVVTLIHEGDVEAVAFARQGPTALIANKRKKPETASVPLLPAPEVEESPEDDAPPVSSWPWLTLDQAAKYSKLTKRWLLQEAESTVLGKETAFPFRTAVRDMGKHAPGGRWRFHRESLEKV